MRKYYLINENNGEALKEAFGDEKRIYTGTKKEMLQEALRSMSSDWYTDGLRIKNHYENYGRSYHLQAVSEYERQKTDRQKMLTKICSIQEVIDMADEMRYSYFWDNNLDAQDRAYYDDKHSTPEVCWEEGGHTYSAMFTTHSSRHNIYAKGYYYKDGVKTNLRAIRCSCDRMWDVYQKQYRLGEYVDLPEKTKEKDSEEKKTTKKKQNSRSL